jgi:hypothetical protein
MIRRSLKTRTSSLVKLGAGAAFFAALSFSGSAQALVINLGNVSTFASDLVTYTSGELVQVEFTVDAPLTYKYASTLTDTSTTPPIVITQNTSGVGSPTEVTETFHASGVSGGLLVSVTTSAVPEVSTWAMMLLGFAGLGFAGYSRGWARKVGVAAI